MKIYRTSFYKLLVNILRVIEQEQYDSVTFIGKTEKCYDINRIKVINNINYYILDQEGNSRFTETVKKSEYMDYNYYKSEVTELPINVMSNIEMRNLLLQGLINYKYLVVLYDILLNIYNQSKQEILSLSNEDINAITQQIKFYSDYQKKIENQMGIVRKRDQI